MIPTIRAAGPKALNRRLFSNSARTNVAVASIAHNTSAASSTSRAAKIAVYTVLGSTAVVAGASHLLKDEVVYWTPNVRNFQQPAYSPTLLKHITEMTATPAMVASGSFSNNNKTEPVVHAASFAIDIPASARSALKQPVPPTTPPLLSSSASSSNSFDSFEAAALEEQAVVDHSRRLSHIFFPRQTKFESVVPVVVRARDIHLKDHPIVPGAFAEYERLYNADSLMTVDGRPMVRLL